MADKLITYKVLKKYIFSRLKLEVETFDHSTY